MPSCPAAPVISARIAPWSHVSVESMDRLAELFARGPVLFDGAMGTELLARGVASGR